jgi:hypothetical protein
MDGFSYRESDIRPMIWNRCDALTASLAAAAILPDVRAGPPRAQPTRRKAMTHFLYMDSEDPTKVAAWYGSVDPAAF